MRSLTIYVICFACAIVLLVALPPQVLFLMGCWQLGGWASALAETLR